jgi:hypothetical protein
MPAHNPFKSKKLLPGKIKRKMQNVSFTTIDEFFDFLPEEELKLVHYLRQLIFDCIPDCKEKLSYNVPYYYGHSSICFIWPSSISWGHVKQEKTVRLGFTKAYLLHDELNYLDKGTRKQVYWKDFENSKEIDKELIKSFLLEAVNIDLKLARAKIKTKK